MNKIAIRVIGYILVIIGIILLLLGISAFSSFANNLAFSAVGSAMGGMFFIFIGGACVLIGAFMVYASYIGKIVSYATKEVAPGVETVSKAVGKGISEGYKGKKK